MQAYSIDLRERVVAFVDSGGSRREAARVFGISASSAIRFVAQWQRECSLKAKPQGGDRRRKLASFCSEIISAVEAKPDITMPELAAVMAQDYGLEVAPASLSRFLCRNGFTYKKNATGHGTRSR